jgi:3-hydroxyisobutyrate dehydrogenase
VDLHLLGEVVRHSDKITGGPGAVMLRTSAEPLADDDGLRPIFTHTRGLGEKDLTLALGLATDHGIDLPFARLALDHLGAALGVPHDQEHP